MSTPLHEQLITFEKATHQHEKLIFSWLNEPHMQEFWDNSQEHKDDIVNFINGRKESSNYFNGIFTYWVGKLNDEPFCFILTAEVKMDDECPRIWSEYISKTGKTYSIDFGIGSPAFIGKGLASLTLRSFTEFFQKCIDPMADTFFIDPDDNNSRAQHVYTKAGFNMVATYQSEKKYWDFSGEKTYLMVKRMSLSFDTKEPHLKAENIFIRRAKETDIPMMVNLSYVKRRDYEKVQPEFWGYAEGAEEKQSQWFKELLVNEDYILLVAEISNQIVGFIIGRLMLAPAVYNPGGLTLMIDDYCVAEISLWMTVGEQLISEIKELARKKNAVQVLVTCGAHDEPKRQFLRCFELTLASEWYVGSIK